jgi:hypothetical protein
MAIRSRAPRELSKVVEIVKSVNHANNCIFCHDPHAAKLRLARCVDPGADAQDF